MTIQLEQLRRDYPSKHAAAPTVLREVLVRAVNASGLTHAAIARRAGIDRSTVSYLLNGRRIGTLDTWDRVLTAAGVELGFRISDLAAAS